MPPAMKASKSAYAAMEIRFLWTNIVYFRLSQGKKQGNKGLMIHTRQQQDALAALDKILDADTLVFPNPTASQAKYEVLYSLYFPENNTFYARKPFSSPLKVFLSLLCLDRQPERAFYASLSDFPPLLSKMQFSVRLAGFHKLVMNLEALNPTNLLEEDPDWLE